MTTTYNDVLNHTQIHNNKQQTLKSCHEPRGAKPHKEKHKLVKRRTTDLCLCPGFMVTQSLAEELWHQLAGCLPPLGTAWVKRRGRAHPACTTHCLAALYTSPGLQQSPPKACSTGWTVGWSQHWYIAFSPNNVDVWSKGTGEDGFLPDTNWGDASAHAGNCYTLHFNSSYFANSNVFRLNTIRYFKPDAIHKLLRASNYIMFWNKSLNKLLINWVWAVKMTRPQQ